MRYRVRVEVEYFLQLTEIPLEQLSGFEAHHADPMRRIYQDFSEGGDEQIQEVPIRNIDRAKCV